MRKTISIVVFTLFVAYMAMVAALARISPTTPLSMYTLTEGNETYAGKYLQAYVYYTDTGNNGAWTRKNACSVTRSLGVSKYAVEVCGIVAVGVNRIKSRMGRSASVVLLL